ncbi:MAG TPA: hypothetical protein VGX50_14850, partial [Longimicrobium sp.]|nr:hypothetical protein [Longimicrobium sp.]
MLDAGGRARVEWRVSSIHTAVHPTPPDPQTEMNHSPARALTAEAIGTFALCFVGILAINVDTISG